MEENNWLPAVIQGFIFSKTFGVIANSTSIILFIVFLGPKIGSRIKKFVLSERPASEKVLAGFVLPLILFVGAGQVQDSLVKKEVGQLAGKIVEIPGGTFRMGDLSGEGRVDELPVHSVTVPPFKIGKYEVTFAQWDACVADGGCRHRPDDRGSGWDRGNHPVINVSWDDIQEFIAWLNANTNGGYRLPTESEWEYAARAGSESKYSWGDEIGVNQANCKDDLCGDEWDKTAPVGSFPANAWGLHDMHGNVYEWVEDCWNGGYEGAPDDGSAWEGRYCSRRVIRGGSWSNAPGELRGSVRGWGDRSYRGVNIGLRLAKDR